MYKIELRKRRKGEDTFQTYFSIDFEPSINIYTIIDKLIENEEEYEKIDKKLSVVSIFINIVFILSYFFFGAGFEYVLGVKEYDAIAEIPICKCADVTDPEVIKQLDIANVDVVIICMANNLEASVMAVMLCKEAGVILTGAGATFPYGKDPADKNIRIAPSFPTPEEMKTAAEVFVLCTKLVSVEKLLSEM